MSKEITAEELEELIVSKQEEYETWFNEFGYAFSYIRMGDFKKGLKEVAEQYAKAKVLQALEKEVPKAFMNCYINREIENGSSTGLDDAVGIIEGREYYETEVKPKYE